MHCGFCLPACPTYTRLGDEADSPRGRLYLMRAVAEGRLATDSDAFQLHIDRCVGCRACETVCPSGVEYGALLERARGAAAAARPPGWLTRMLLAVFSSAGATRVFMSLSRVLRATRLPALAARLLPDVGFLGQARLAAAMLASARSWRRPRSLLRRAGRPLSRETLAASSPGGADAAGGVAASVGPALGGAGFTAGLLEGCVQEGLFAEVNRATRRVLEANGWRVSAVAGQGCCGALHAHGGDLEGARALARRNVDAFREARVDVVVVNAAGCGAVMKEYGELLAGDPDYERPARAFAESVRDVSEVLAAAGPVVGGPLPLVVTYDAPCHLLHGQRIADAPLAILASVPGLVIRPLPSADECCGGAGIYGLTHPELGGQIGRDKARAVMGTGAEVVASGNPGCLMQIGAWLRMSGSDIEPAHPVEILDESYRRGGLYREDAR